MEVQQRHRLTSAQYADRVKLRGSGLFQSKELRDIVARTLRQRGITVRCSSIRNQQLHPEYVTDYVGTLETGFGNTQYRTFFSVLYRIQIGG